MAAAAAAIAAVSTAATSAASAVQSLGQLGETTSPREVPEWSASPAETTTLERRSVVLAPGAHVSRLRQGEHFHAEFRATRTTSAPAPQHYPYSASSSGAHVSQYGSCPWHEYSGGHSNASSYGPPPPPASYAPTPPMPSSPRPDGPPPPVPPSESDWSFSSGHSQALQAQFVPPGEFPSSDSSGWNSNGNSVDGSYIPSAFVGQPVGTKKVGNIWLGDSGATTHMTLSTDLMYDTRPPPPHRSRVILGDGSIKKVHSSEPQQDRLPGNPLRYVICA